MKGHNDHRLKSEGPVQQAAHIGRDPEAVGVCLVASQTPNSTISDDLYALGWMEQMKCHLEYVMTIPSASNYTWRNCALKSYFVSGSSGRCRDSKTCTILSIPYTETKIFYSLQKCMYKGKKHSVYGWRFLCRKSPYAQAKQYM